MDELNQRTSMLIIHVIIKSIIHVHVGYNNSVKTNP